jgi:hypothetical protein
MSPALRAKCADDWKTAGPDECLFLLDAPHAHGGATARPAPYLLTDSLVEEVIDELLQAAGNIRLSAAGCSHHISRQCRGIGRALPDLLSDHCPTCCPT